MLLCRIRQHNDVTKAHLDLPLHGDAKERDEVHDEDGPEDGDVEEIEEGANEGDGGGLRR